MRTLFLAPLVLVLAGCPSAPSEPTWAEDVKPILAANCVRCHTVPPIGGAPDRFRLDVLENTVDDNGRTVFGAATMAEFIVARTDAKEMPPRFPLRGRQIDVLKNWLEQREEVGLVPPTGAPLEGNRAPTGELRTPLDMSVDGESLTVHYEFSDLDRDILTGSLLARAAGETPIVVTNLLGGGRGQAVWDFGSAPTGSYELAALVSDGSSLTDISLGQFEVSNTNTAPSARFAAPLDFAVLSDLESPFAVMLDVADPDVGDTLILTLDAVRNETEVVNIATAIPVTVGANAVAWDTSRLDEGLGWRLRATVSDGTSSRTVTSQEVLVSHATTSLTFNDVAEIFNQACGLCHPGSGALARVPSIPHDFTQFAPVGLPGVFVFRSEIYRRVILQRAMPPSSKEHLFPDSAEFTDAQRETLAEWLLAGSPQ